MSMIRRRLMSVKGLNERIDMSNYLTIEALEDGLTASLSLNAVEYSIDGTSWQELAAGTATPSVNTGERIYFRATGLTPTSSAGIGTFTISKACNLGGNVMSLLFGDDAESAVSLEGYRYAFVQLFYQCTTIRNVADDFLPATTLAIHCYSAMFRGCTGLTEAPELPATTLASYCYYSMFDGCTGLTEAPELPATTLASNCYYSMFDGCTGLTEAPELPATTLTSNCYDYMFYGCTRLKYIKALFTTTPSSAYTEYWVGGVASTGTFVKRKDATWDVTGVNGVPSGWTIESV